MLHSVLRWLPFVAAETFALAASHTQDPARPGPAAPIEVTREQVLARRDQGKPFWDNQWIVRDDGALTQLPNPAAGGSTAHVGMSFVGDEYPPAVSRDPLAQNLHERFDSWSAAPAWLAPLLRHPGDLLGATFADRHFTQLGRDAGDVALRQFLVLPDTAPTQPQLRRERLDRELAIRLLQQRGARHAVGELRAVVKGTGDTCLQRAAQEALAALAGDPAPPRVVLAQLSIEVPTSADFWLWIDTARLAPDSTVATAVRTAVAEKLWREVLEGGGRLCDLQLAGAQFLVDVPEEMPYEAARLWGRARFDQCLLAFRSGRDGVELAWAAASGSFEVEVLSRYLEACKVPHAEADGLVSSSEWWPGLAVEVARDHVVVRSKSGLGAPAGRWPAVVAAAVACEAAVAGALPAGSAMESVPWLLLDGESMATVRLSPFS
ncbi:MAG TPA: hypothetical protein VFZ65_08965, partial [Planctomycetota bacterium]|nr:hypothetical protein [Planctomycetota bacterium]